MESFACPSASWWVAGVLYVLFPWRNTNLPGDLLTSFPHQTTGRYFCPLLGWADHKVAEIRPEGPRKAEAKEQGLSGKPSLTCQTGGKLPLQWVRRHTAYLSGTSCVLVLSLFPPFSPSSLHSLFFLLFGLSFTPSFPVSPFHFSSLLSFLFFSLSFLLSFPPPLSYLSFSFSSLSFTFFHYVFLEHLPSWNLVPCFADLYYSKWCLLLPLFFF